MTLKKKGRTKNVAIVVSNVVVVVGCCWTGGLAAKKNLELPRH